MIAFRFSGLRTDRSRLEHPADVLVGITAEFEVDADGVPLYSEDDFPVVELAAELADWLRNGFAVGADFEFDSMSTPEAGWVWIRRDDGKWRVGSLHQERPDLTPRDDEEVRAAVADFVERVRSTVASELGADVTSHLEANQT